MAYTASLNPYGSNTIQTGEIVQAPHVYQFVRAFTANEAYDILISGSLIVTGSTKLSGSLNVVGLSSATQSLLLVLDSSGSVYAMNTSSLIPTGNILGSGLDKYVPLWSGSSYLTSSIIYQTGNKIGINTTNPVSILTISGGLTSTGSTNLSGALNIVGISSNNVSNVLGIDTNGNVSVTAVSAVGALPAGQDWDIQLKNGSLFAVAGLGRGFYNNNVGAWTLGYREGIIGSWSFVANQSSSATQDYASAFGRYTLASNTASHAQNYYTTASGLYSHAEGQYTLASGQSSHAEGAFTVAFGNNSYAGGYQTVAFGNYAHAEGSYTSASGNSTHAEGSRSLAIGSASHVEGYLSTSSGNFSHAEGLETITLGIGSHAEGIQTSASGNYSHAEGNSSQAIGPQSHAEGYNTRAIGNGSHAGGRETFASGNYSFTMGTGSFAMKEYSFAGGQFTIASGSGQTVLGKFNKQNNTTDLFVIGNGASDASRSDIFIISPTHIGISSSISASLAANTVGFYGTSSWAINSTTSSYAITASYALNAAGGGGGTPGGANRTIQFNDGGTFSGSGTFTFNKSTNKVNLTGSMIVSSSGNGQFEIQGSGSSNPIFSTYGSQGPLLTIIDDLTGSLLSVRDISGIPVFEANSDSTITLGKYASPALFTTTSSINASSGISTAYAIVTSSYTGLFIDWVATSGSGTNISSSIGSMFVNWTQGTGQINYSLVTGSKIPSALPLFSYWNLSASLNSGNAQIQVSGSTAGWNTKFIIKGI